jgi:hypothetical protein
VVLAVTHDAPMWAVLQGNWGTGELGNWGAGGQLRADGSAAPIPADAWQRLAAGDGANGPRW